MIKFHRPFEGYTEGHVIELDPSMEYMLVSQNYANYHEAPVAKPVKASKKKVDVVEPEALEGGEA